MEILKNFNDSLSLNSNHETKGFLRFIAVASADVVGAYELGRIGVKIGAIVGLKGALIGGAIGGIVGGVGASYVAYCGTRPETTSSLDSPTIDMIVAGYSRIIVSDSLMQSYVVGEINLNFPEKFNDDAIRTGKMHNLILDISLNGTIYSYGLHDPEARFLMGSAGEGVLVVTDRDAFFKNSLKSFIQFSTMFIFINIFNPSCISFFNIFYF